MCQIEKIDEMGYEDSNLNIRHNINVIIKKIGIYSITNKIFRHNNKILSKKIIPKNSHSLKSNNILEPGDIVIVRSKEEILETLDENNKLEGCGFMEEMWKFCNTQQKVLKRVNYFFDERNSKFYKTKDIVLLKGNHCSGKLSKLMPRCDRSCYYFWKERWLKKIN
jgi:hypothetical protein